MNADARSTPLSFPVTRSAVVPDRLRLARFRASPEYGPRVLFFSGGTALNRLSQKLAEYTHNSIHLTTPFDSGGSSGKLRGPFDILGVGDMRSRLMALADRTVKGQDDVYALFAHRLEKGGTRQEARAVLERIVGGEEPIIGAVRQPMRDIIRNHLRFFLEGMPDGFDLRGASIGNLVLVGGYLNNRRNFESVIFLFSKLVEVRGTVRPTVSDSLHLRALLEDGTELVGQHLLTGKEVGPISAPVKEFSLVHTDPPHEAAGDVAINERTAKLISQADLICFPMGSFYSSVLANLLPSGVGRAIGERRCPKVFVPNTGSDPEQVGLSVADCAEKIITRAREDWAECGADAGESGEATLIETVVLAEEEGAYAIPIEEDRLRKMGLRVLKLPLVSRDRAPLLDEDRLIEVLLSLA